MNFKIHYIYIILNLGWATSATPDGETCLHLIAISKNVEVAKKLIDLGADVNRRVTHSLVSLKPLLYTFNKLYHDFYIKSNDPTHQLHK